MENQFVDISIDGLSEFGEVKKCQISDRELHITIGKGFKSNARKTFEFIGFICEKYPEYDVVEKAITETDNCELILKRTIKPPKYLSFKTKYNQYNVYVETHNVYSNGRKAIEIKESLSGAPVVVATVNIPEARLSGSEVIIKDWSENEGTLKFLQDNGFVGPVKRHVPTGHVFGDVCDFLIK